MDALAMLHRLLPVSCSRIHAGESRAVGTPCFSAAQARFPADTAWVYFPLQGETTGEVRPHLSPEHVLCKTAP